MKKIFIAIICFIIPLAIVCYLLIPTTNASNINEFIPMNLEQVDVNYVSNISVINKKQINLPLQMLSRFQTKLPVVDSKKDINIEKILFIGNSLSVGLDAVDDGKYNFIAKVSATITSTRNEGRYENIKNYDFETVVIGFGTNELGAWTLERWREEFEILLDVIYAKNPNASIVIMSPPPLSEIRSNRGDRINNKNVEICTQHLKTIADEFNVYFLDNVDFFGNVLDYNWTGDGVHLYGSVYKNWLDFIVIKLSEM